MNQTLTWTSKVAGIVTSMNFLQKKMEKQKQSPPAKASMIITEDDIAEEMRTGVDELLTKFDDVSIIHYLTSVHKANAGLGTWTL